MTWKDEARLRDAVTVAMEMANGITDGVGIIGYGIAVLRDEERGLIKSIDPFANLITTVGDEYYAKRGAAGVSPANPAQPTLASGMKLGTGSTAAAKSGAGAALVAYISGSNNPFSATFPSTVAAGSDVGWNINYQTLWAAGDVTNSAIREVVLVTDAGEDDASAAADTISRFVFASARDKTASDSLTVNWSHKFLGA